MENQEEVEQATTETAETSSEDWQTKFEAMRREMRKQESRAKENADKAKRFDEMEEKSKTELQKALERAEKAEKAKEQADLLAVRAEISAQTGVPLSMIHGQTREEMESAAETAKQWRGTSSAPVVPSAEGAGNKGDKIGSKGDQITSRDQLKKMTPEEILQARKDGRLDTLMGITPKE